MGPRQKSWAKVLGIAQDLQFQVLGAVLGAEHQKLQIHNENFFVGPCAQDKWHTSREIQPLELLRSMVHASSPLLPDCWDCGAKGALRSY